MTTINRDLLKAYKETEFIFFPDNRREILKIGKKSSYLDRVLKSNNLKSALYITSWNPYSKSLKPTANKKRQQNMINYLSKNRFLIIHGFGRSKDCLYHEDSVLILGCSREEAIELGIKYKQNAVVFYEAKRPAELLLLK